MGELRRRSEEERERERALCGAKSLARCGRELDVRGKRQRQSLAPLTTLCRCDVGVQVKRDNGSGGGGGSFTWPNSLFLVELAQLRKSSSKRLRVLVVVRYERGFESACVCDMRGLVRVRHSLALAATVAMTTTGAKNDDRERTALVSLRAGRPANLV